MSALTALENDKFVINKTKIKFTSISLLYSSLKSSFCWKNFGSLVIESDGKKRMVAPNQVFCMVCLEKAKNDNEEELFGSVTVKSYSTKVSTGNLIRHLKEKHQLSEDKTKHLPELKSFFSPKPNRPSTSSVTVKSCSTKVSTGNLIRHMKEEHQLSEDETENLPDLKSFFSPNPNRPSTSSVTVKSCSTKVSTGNLLWHIKEEHQLSEDETENLPDRNSFFISNPNRPSTSRSGLKNPTKWMLARDLALWLCRSLLPFDSISDDALIDFLKKYNIIATAEDLPTRTMISRNAVDDVYECMLAHIKKTLASSVTGHAAITTDLWSDCYKRNNYMTMKLHFINELFDLENVTLVTELIEGPKTGEKVFTFVYKTLQKYELQDKYVFLVSDAGSNLTKAASLLSEQMTSVNHLCLGHGLHNLIVVDGIKSTPNLNNLVIKCKSIVQALRFKLPELAELADQKQRKILNSVEDVGEVIDNEENMGWDLEEIENSIVTKYEPSEALSQLPKSVVTIKNATPTRWHSILIMLERLYNKYNQAPINQLLEKSHNEDLKITDSEWRLMKYLIAFLAKFRECATILSAQKSCTINLALVYKMELADIMNSLDDDEPIEIFKMKKNMKAKLDERLPTNDLTVAATLLDCRFQAIDEVDKYLTLHGTDRVSFLASYTRRVVKKEHLCTPSPATTVSNTVQAESSSSRLFQLYLKYGASTGSCSAEDRSNDFIETECWKYFAECYPRDYSKNDIDILKYWKDRQSSFPYLSTLAKRILCVPATSTPNESVFSVAGLSITAKRSRLSGTNVNKIIFIHDNYENCKKIVN